MNFIIQIFALFDSHRWPIDRFNEKKSFHILLLSLLGFILIFFLSNSVNMVNKIQLANVHSQIFKIELTLEKTGVIV